jgi:nucleotide-binding universal stress UspA family protein
MLSVQAMLVPVDFSDCSQDALRYAASLAEIFDARISVRHFIPPTSSYSGVPFGSFVDPASGVTLDASAVQEAEAHLDRLVLETVPALAEGIRRSVRRADPARGIVEAARQEGFDLIVMGTHGRRGFDRFVMGSVAEQVLRRAPVPVVTVRQGGGVGHDDTAEAPHA